MTAETTTGDGVLLTETAASKVKILLESEGREDLTLHCCAAGWLLRSALSVVL